MRLGRRDPIEKLQSQLRRARERLAVVEEQIPALWEDPDGEPHVRTAERERAQLRAEVERLTAAIDDALDRRRPR